MLARRCRRSRLRKSVSVVRPAARLPAEPDPNARLYREVSDLIKTYSLEAVNEASLTVLGYPAVMITYRSERYQVSQKLKGLDPTPRPIIRVVSKPTIKPTVPVPVQPKQHTLF